MVIKKPLPASKAMKLAQGNSIDKVCAVLILLAEHQSLRLSEVSHAIGLNRVTALRILDSLCANDFVRRSGSPPRYSFGPEITAMTLSSPLPNLREIIRPSLLRMADISGDAAILSVRSGVDAICIDKMIGDYPINNHTLDIGVRRPLGVGAGSMALLAWSPPSEHEVIIDISLTRSADFYPKLTRNLIYDTIQHSREVGYVVLLDVVVERLGGIACPIYDAKDNVVAALSVTGLRERIASRESELAEALLHEQERIRKILK